MDRHDDIVRNKMFGNDAFSQWLGIDLITIEKGYCKLSMKVTKEMLNGFKIAHGGISYSLADSCFAFASNSHGKKAVSIETSISHTHPIFENDILTASSTCLKEGKTISIYQIIITNQNEKTVALFKGTVHKSGEEW